ncbi:hypothetical protein [Actinomadura darangshiensis]|uniref:hypothetical protein n=1 Tax=Actinomadura darangshiensis TaxID=705336 RepID=UPI001FB713E9|nr:hypothetical protein [Actinomadura darangshiensis]
MRLYHYVGHPEILAEVRPGSGGEPIRSPDDLAAWPANRSADETAEPLTFVMDVDGFLRSPLGEANTSPAPAGYRS